ncbi:FecR domain-containing protein [Marinimicrobium sp. C6131]|uniref:FecR family protein n=1 Tax=Marinimicrobium sp. C6131 TaxID=3022676 RepID=UPI00223D4B68|nr:FecR domain-containing protein [Marinimicrobium sp. C6131]UZJ43979.1 FecR domain-containing protein [Marinimicrobium sp. C6131]
MSNVIPLQTDESIYDDASLWIARLDRGLSEQETSDLRRWLSQSSRHRECLMEMAELWDRMDSLSVLSELFDPPAHSTRGKWFGLGAATAVAASVLFVVSAFGLFAPLVPWSGESQPPELSTMAQENTVYETGIGAHSTVNLPDGTRMLLNTNTLVSVTYSNDERLLELTRGELHVEVEHDPSRPLRVKAGGKVVEAVGTAFNVYLIDDEDVDVIVTEGTVHVKSALSESTDEPVQELTKGQTLAIRAQQPKYVGAMDEAVIEDRLSWRDGNLVFRGETLQEALAEVSRYTTLEFKVADPAITKVRIAGLYRAGDIDGLLMALRENFDIEHHRTDGGTVVLSSMDSTTPPNGG